MKHPRTAFAAKPAFARFPMLHMLQSRIPQLGWSRTDISMVIGCYSIVYSSRSTVVDIVIACYTYISRSIVIGCYYHLVI